MLGLNSSRFVFVLLLGISLKIPAVLANVVGTDAQNFNTTTSGLDFVTVHSSETLLPGVFNIGLYANNAWNALPRFEGQPDYRDRLLGMDFNFGVGLANRWDAGVSLPSVLYQTVTNQAGFSGRYSATGMTEVRINTKYRLFGEMDGGLALVASTNLNLIRNNPYAGNGAGPTWNLEGVYDHTFGKFAVGANAGYRWRNSGTQIAGLPIRPFGNQWIASLATSYLFPQADTKLIAEVFGSLPTASKGGDSDREQSSLEFLLGAKHDFSHHFAGHLGAGRELLSGLASPNFRAYIGLNFQFGPVFSEKEERAVFSPPPAPPPRRMSKVAVAVPPLPPPPKEETFTFRRILFDFNSFRLTPNAKQILTDFSSYLKRTNYRKVEIEGHTDSVGDDVFNQSLSEMRAKAIRAELIRTHGIDPAKITAAGFGEGRPLADNGNYQGRDLNRRVDFRISR
jgi:outer membrane protein OmpA-like peptidoglycan-associated protein